MDRELRKSSWWCPPTIIQSLSQSCPANSHNIIQPGVKTAWWSMEPVQNHSPPCETQHMTNLESDTKNLFDKNFSYEKVLKWMIFFLLRCNLVFCFRVNTGHLLLLSRVTTLVLLMKLALQAITLEVAPPVFPYHQAEMISPKLVTPPMQVWGQEMVLAWTTMTPPGNLKMPKNVESFLKWPPTSSVRGCSSIWHIHIHQKTRRNNLLRTLDYQYYKSTTGSSMQGGE